MRARPTVLGLLTVAATAMAMLGPVSPGQASTPARPSRPSSYDGVRHDKGPLSSRLAALVAARSAGLSAAATAQALSVPTAGAGSLLRTADGSLVVVVRFAKYAAAQVAAVEEAGATVVNRNPAMSRVTVTVSDADLTAVGEVAGVQYVDDVLEPQVNATCDSTISEGDAKLRAADLRSTRSLTGAGVKVGVISDSYDRATGVATTAEDDVTSDNLPGTTNTCGHTTPVTLGTQPTTGSDEGRAMAQLVHDLAPGADIDFESAFIGEDEFAASIGKLADQGAKVIVDDISYFDEPMYQDGVVAQAVTAVRARGVNYFSSSANNRNILDGNEVGSYEAVDGYRPATCPSIVAAEGYLDCHDFNTSGAADPTFSFTGRAATAFKPVLNWAEPWNTIQTDLDLLLVDTTTGTIVAGSGNQNPGSGGSQKAFEIFSTNLVTNHLYDLVVARYPSTAPATPRFKLVFAENGRKPFKTGTMDHPTATGSDVMGPTTYGHNGGTGTMSVGASSATVSPTALEDFSSYGPVTTLFGPVSGTGAAAALPAPLVVAKPDLVASDCTHTTFFVAPDNVFCGTSAAAPHAAAVAALLLQQKPAATSDQINGAMLGTAVPIAGVPASFQGAGLVDALPAGDALAAAPPAAPALTATDPPSPSASTTPSVVGSAPAGTTVRVFANATCQGAPAATGTAAALASPGLPVTVASRSTTSFSALASSSGSTSACSTTTLSYTNDVPATAAPTLTGTSPASPDPSTTTNVVGTAATGSTVEVYTDAGCTGVPAASGSAAALASPGLPVVVAAATSTTFWATATTGADNTSACSSTSVTYVNNAPAPTLVNTTPIQINDNAAASPYPSAITVSGLTNAISDVDVTIDGFSHSYSSDVGIVLQAPNGDSIVLMDGVADGVESNDVTFTFDDEAATQASERRGLPNGSVRPGDYIARTFAAPAPSTGAAAPLGTTTLESAFDGDNPNGTWKLFVQDFFAGDDGEITGGWSLKIDTVTVPTPTLSGTTPASPNPSLTPSVSGTAPAGSTVKLYTNPTCTSPVAATGTAAAFGSPGLPVSVAAGSTTTFYATATDAGSNLSACSTTSATYVQQAAAPPVPPVAPDTTLTEVPKKKIKSAKRKVKVSFGFVSSVPGATFTCTLDGKSVAPCVSGMTIKVKKGKHVFTVTSTANGLTDASPATYSFKVKPKSKR